VHLRPIILLFTLLAVLLAGCAMLPSQHEAAKLSDLEEPVPVAKIPPPQVDDEKPIKIITDDKAHLKSKSEIQPGSGSFIDEGAARAPVPGGAAVSAEGQITFNFENQPIQAVVQAILGALLKENYTIAPNVTGNVTFSTSKPITPEQAMPILQMLLAWTNNALVRKEGRYEVLPVKEAIPGNLTPRIAPAAIAKGYEVRVFPLKYISATEMQKLLKPYAKADAIISADSARNMMVMAGTASELANYQRTIEVFDVDWLKGMSVGVYALRNTDVSKVQPELDKIFGAAGESPLAGMFRFIPMDATNSIVVITSQPDYLKQAEGWLYRLDLGAGENGTQLYVYDVKNVKAVDLSDHLNAIFTGQATQRSTGGVVAPGLKSVNIGGLGTGIGATGSSTGSSMTQRSSYTGTSQTQGRSANGAIGTNSNLSTTGTGAPGTANAQKPSDIRITPIEENNQLLVMATPAEWDSILAAIRRLDISPLQVQIEAKILEVSLTGDLSYGVQWWLAGLINNTSGSNYPSTGYKYGPDYQGNPSNRHRASLGAGAGATPTANGGLFYSFLNRNFQVAINALQTNGQSKVLSTPSLVVLNNQQAQITVGTQVPLISTSIVGYGTGTTATSDTGTSVSGTGIDTASYISTGVTLSVTPRVNPGGLVYMDVSQEDSVAQPAVGTNPNPPIAQRNLQTQVAVQSGDTVLLGGMIQDNSTDSKSGLPGIANIPIIGSLFGGNTTHDHERTELIVLITPRVIVNSDDAREMTEEYEHKFEALAPLYAQPRPKAPAQPAPPPAETTPLPAAPPPAEPQPQPENQKD
jgi:general secretion pathway protein D